MNQKRERNKVLRLRIFIIVILLYIPLGLFAKPYSLGFGAVQEFQIGVGEPTIQTADLIDVNNWATGSELRFELLNLISLDGYVLIKQGTIVDVTENGNPVFANDIFQHFFGMVALSIKTEVASLTTLSIGAGTQYGLDLYSNDNPRLWVSSKDNIVGVSSFDEFKKNLSIAYRARLDFNFSRFSLGVFFLVPSIAGENDSLAPDWKKGKIGASFITRVI